MTPVFSKDCHTDQRSHLALVAALVTLLMLGFGTFTQQAVATNMRHVETETPCTIARALSYKATPSMIALAQPNGPSSAAFQDFSPSYLDGGQFSGMLIISVHDTCIVTNIESSGYYVV